MKQVLGRKQTTDNAEWLHTFEHIEELVSCEELDAFVAEKVRQIQRVIGGKKVGYAWSGGKDSLVLSHICHSIGVTDCCFAHTELEYPAFLKWCLDNKPENCTVYNTGQDLKWLTKHQRMIFPKGKDLIRWYMVVQRKAFTQFFFDHGLDMILVGHRRIDGNTVGKDGIIRNKTGETRYAAIADWPHEMVLAYIHYHGIELPPIYQWKNGFKCGTHPWPSRMYIDDPKQGYQEVWDIDKSIVIAAAERLPSARAFLEGVRS